MLWLKKLGQKDQPHRQRKHGFGFGRHSLAHTDGLQKLM
jgi:hypothetical protein